MYEKSIQSHTTGCHMLMYRIKDRLIAIRPPEFNLDSRRTHDPAERLNGLLTVHILA